MEKFKKILSLRFCMKSILAVLEGQKLKFFVNFEVLNFDFEEFIAFCRSEFYLNKNSEPLELF